MTRQEKYATVSMLYSLIETGFKRIEELEADGQHGLAHTAMREQINGLVKLVKFYEDNETSPFVWQDWVELKKLLGEKKKRHGWFGWL